MPKKMNLLDLFSGIGGFHLGLEKAGFKFDKVFNSDVDKYANAVYKYNFKESINVGSVTNVRGIELPKIDAITFGSPCQDFSIAGSRSGLEGSRSSLISEAIRLISECRPRFFIWENVKGTFSSNNGEDFWAIIQAFTNIGGYRLEWQLLNTSWFLPQNRERIYLVGCLGKGSGEKIFPIGENDKVHNNGSSGTKPKTQISGAITTGEGSRRESNFVIGDFRYDEGFRWRNNNNSPTLKKKSNEILVKIKNRNAPMIPTRASNDGSRQSVIKYNYGQKSLNETLQKSNLKKDDVKALDLYNKKAQDISPTLTEPHHNSLRLYDKSKIRRLTPIECCRLQGFPDYWNEKGIIDGEIVKISDAQKYKQCGNAVTVDVVQAVGEKIYAKKTKSENIS
jgi:DNA (cytosine-5)-methyltransferase 1